MNLRSFLLVVPIVLAALPGPLLAQKPELTPAVLSGDWRFDSGRSDDLEQKLKSRGGLMSRPMGGGGRGGGAGGVAGGMGERGEMLSALRPPQQLSIVGTDSAVAFRVDLGLSRPLYLDGRETVDTLGDLTPRRSRAKWKDGKLEVNRQVGRYGRAREIYRFDAASGMLFVDVKIEGMTKIELRRVYIRVPG